MTTQTTVQLHPKFVPLTAALTQAAERFIAENVRHASNRDRLLFLYAFLGASNITIRNLQDPS
jgi:hypothetical protein